MKYREFWFNETFPGMSIEAIVPRNKALCNEDDIIWHLIDIEAYLELKQEVEDLKKQLKAFHDASPKPMRGDWD